jgi:hypothetical protein
MISFTGPPARLGAGPHLWRRDQGDLGGGSARRRYRDPDVGARVQVQDPPAGAVLTPRCNSGHRSQDRRPVDANRPARSHPSNRGARERSRLDRRRWPLPPARQAIPRPPTRCRRPGSTPARAKTRCGRRAHRQIGQFGERRGQVHAIHRRDRTSGGSSGFSNPVVQRRCGSRTAGERRPRWARRCA